MRSDILSPLNLKGLKSSFNSNSSLQASTLDNIDSNRYNKFLRMRGEKAIVKEIQDADKRYISATEFLLPKIDDLGHGDIVIFNTIRERTGGMMSLYPSPQDLLPATIKFIVIIEPNEPNEPTKNLLYLWDLIRKDKISPKLALLIEDPQDFYSLTGDQAYKVNDSRLHYTINI